MKVYGEKRTLAEVDANFVFRPSCTCEYCIAFREFGLPDVDVGGTDFNKSGLKFDDGKVPVWSGLLQYFPLALEAIADVSDYGFKKYKAWGGWRDVPDGVRRYTNAKARHLLEQAKDGDMALDKESGKLHVAMEAWNALARLELLLGGGTQK